MRHAVILGGGGFIGSAFYEGYAKEFETVTVVDRFSGPSHSTLSNFHSLREQLRPRDRLMTADVIEVANWPELLRAATHVLILNADTGTGSSFHRPSSTVDQNLSRVARLTELVRQHCDPKTTRVVFTSSRAVYGEGHWRCQEHGSQAPNRAASELQNGRFEPRCAVCRSSLTLFGSRETDPARPLSVYGLTKAAGEQLLNLTLCQSGFDVRIVRYQNIYGTGQAIDNPYTGVLNWFSQALIEGRTVKVFEEGRIVRDFLFVTDGAELLYRLAVLDRPAHERSAPYIVNGGTGVATRLLDIAMRLRELYKSRAEITVTRDFRPGDVLGAVASNDRATDDLGFRAVVSLEEGLARYAAWFKRSSSPSSESCLPC